MMDITETLDECAKHLALREELTIAYSGESNKGENLESSQMIRDVVEFAREQDKTLEKAMVRGTGKTTEEWIQGSTPKLTGDRRNQRISWQKGPTLAEEENLDLPDDWIDGYTMGLGEPMVQNPGKGVTPIELLRYDGSPMTWFRWIGEFKCLIHDTGLGLEQKLTTLSNHLNQDDRRLITDVGGGTQSYKYALKTLKKVWGRKDLIIKAHKKEIEKIGLRGRTAVAFYDFALKVRTHLCISACKQI